MTRALRPFSVWLILIAATLLSYASWMDTGWSSPQLAGSAVILIALAKAWLIGIRYMELDEAARLLQLIYYGWILLVGAMLLTMFWLAA